MAPWEPGACLCDIDSATASARSARVPGFPIPSPNTGWINYATDVLNEGINDIPYKIFVWYITNYSTQTSILYYCHQLMYLKNTEQLLSLL